ncbi:MAG TPA: hypothetical protein VMF61_12355 [Candidatus Acidoferrales bacterium]|nr:hypothetical protein [Candidatus Acidoferrales bacterium]
MPACENCGRDVGGDNYCRNCGTQTLKGARAAIGEERLADLGASITDAYQPEPRARPAWRFAALAAVTAVCAIAAGAGGAYYARVYFERGPPAPGAARVGAAAPALSPSNAPAVVRGEPGPFVGGSNGCTVTNVNVAMPGYPRGCTQFAGATSGALANGQGVALVVPVTAAGSPQNVIYGLLYVQTRASSGPHFAGVLSGDGSGHLQVAVQHGVLVESNATHTKRSTFDGRHIVPVN